MEKGRVIGMSEALAPVADWQDVARPGAAAVALPEVIVRCRAGGRRALSRVLRRSFDGHGSEQGSSDFDNRELIERAEQEGYECSSPPITVTTQVLWTK